MRIKVLVEKKPFKQSSSLPNTSGDGTPVKRSSSCGGMREIENDEDVWSKSAEKQCLFHALEQTTTGKADSCVDISNIVNNSRLQSILIWLLVIKMFIYMLCSVNVWTS